MSRNEGLLDERDEKEGEQHSSLRVISSLHDKGCDTGECCQEKSNISRVGDRLQGHENRELHNYVSEE